MAQYLRIGNSTVLVPDAARPDLAFLAYVSPSVNSSSITYVVPGPWYEYLIVGSASYITAAVVATRLLQISLFDSDITAPGSHNALLVVSPAAGYSASQSAVAQFGPDFAANTLGADSIGDSVAAIPFPLPMLYPSWSIHAIVTNAQAGDTFAGGTKWTVLRIPSGPDASFEPAPGLPPPPLLV